MRDDQASSARRRATGAGSGWTPWPLRPRVDLASFSDVLLSGRGPEVEGLD